MPKRRISDKDVSDPIELRKRLQEAFDDLYELLGRTEGLKAAVMQSRGAGLTPTQQELLRSLAIGSADNPVAAQKPVIRTVDELPPVATATNGEMVRLSTDGIIYIFDEADQSWDDLTAIAAAHNLLSATHGDTNAASPTQGLLIKGTAGNKWGTFALGAAKSGVRVNAAGNDLEQSASVAMEDVANTFELTQTFTPSAGRAITVTAGGIDVDAGGINIDLGGLTVAGGGVIVTGGQFDSSAQYAARVYAGSNQSINDSADTALNFDNEATDQGGIHSNVTNNTRITVPLDGDGLWLFIGQVTFAANATGIRRSVIQSDGAAVLARAISHTNSGTQQTILNLSTIVSIGATGYVELLAYQTSGAALNVIAGFDSTFLIGYKLC